MFTTKVYENKNNRFCTVVSNDDKNGVTLVNEEWGTFTTKFSGSIDWDGFWRKSLKPGEVIPVSRHQCNAKTYIYQTGFSLYPAEEKIKDFINSQEQDVAVKGCIQLPSTSSGCPHETYVECWSPVWGKFNYTSIRIDIQIGDILTVKRYKKEKGSGYYYTTLQNHTSDERLHKASKKILKDFDEAEVNKILLMACQQKMEK